MSTIRTHREKRNRAIINAAAAVFASVSLAAYATAATETWTGTNDTNWNTTGNWTGGNAVPATGDTLIYGTSAQLTSNNDISGLTLATISYASGANAFNLTGNGVGLTGSVTLNGAISETIGLAVTGSANSSLVFGANSSGGETLTLGATDTFGVLTVSSNSSTVNTANIGANTLNIIGTTASTIGRAAVDTSNTNATLNLTGGGAYNQTGGNLTVAVTSGNNGNGTQTAVFDASGLSSFVYNVPTGTVAIGFGAKSNGTLRLANTGTPSNSITAATLSIGDSSGGNNGGTSTLALGGGTNVINANTINIGAGKSSGQITFQHAGGSVTIAGTTGGSSTANITIGRASSATASGNTCSLLLAGHNATVQAGTVTIGQLNGAGGSNLPGNVTFDTGTFTANILQLAVDTSGNSDSTGPRGTFTLGTNSGSTGVLNVNTFRMSNLTSTSATSRTDTSSFIIKGGTANIGSDIALVGSNANVTFNASVTLSGGTLNMGFGGTNHGIGTIAQPLTAVNLPSTAQTATLMNLGSNGIVTTGNTGGGLLMDGAGTLIVAGSNNYSGATTINSGTLAVTGLLPAGSAVTVNSGVLAGHGDGSSTGVVGATTMSGGSGVHPGSTGADGAIGLLTMSGLTVNGGDFRLDMTGSGNDLVNITGTATFTGAATITASPLNLAPNTYTVLTAGSLVNASTNLSFSSSMVGRSMLTFDFSTANTVKVNVTGNPASLTWNNSAPATGDGINWENALVQQNWRNGGTPDFFYDGDFVTFNDTNNGNYAVTVNGTVMPGSVTFGNSSGAYVFSGGGAIAGNTGVTVNGTGTVTMPLANTYTGITTINNGSVLIVSTLANGGVASGIGAATSAAGNLVLSGGTLKWTGGANQTTDHGLTLDTTGGTLDASPTVGSIGLTVSGPIAFANSGARVLTLAGIDPTPLAIAGQTLSSTLNDGPGGATSVVKNGNNGWVLGGVNGYTGGTTINAGRIRASNTSSFGTGSVTVANGATAYLSSSGTYNNNFSIAGIGVAETGTPNDNNYGALRLGANGARVAGTVTLTGDARITGRSATTGATISGQITGNHNLEFGNSAAVGVLVLTNTTNNWTGDTTISLGTVKAGASSGVSDGVIPHGAGAGNVIINGGDTNGDTGNSTLDVNGFNVIINGLSSTGTQSQNFVTNSAIATGTLTVGDNGASSSYAGTLQNGTGALALNKIGAGTLILSGNNTHTGGTTITAGTLQAANAGALGGSTVSLTVNGGTLDLNNNSVTVGDLSGAGGTITNTSASSAVTLTAGASGTVTYAGTIQDNAGTVALTKQGAGTLTLSGASTNTGDTNVSGGSLLVNGSLLSTGNVSVNSGGRLGGTGSVGNLTTNGGSSTDPGAAALAISTLTERSLSVNGGILHIDIGSSSNDLLSVSTTATFNSSSLLQISSTLANLTAGNYTVLTSGGLSGTLPSLSPYNRQTYSLSQVGNSLVLNVSGTSSAGNVTWTGNNGSAWDVQTTQNWKIGASPDYFLQGDNATLNDSASNFNVALDTVVAPASVTVDNTANAYSITGSGGITGTGGLTKRGTNTLTLGATGGLSYTGATSIQNGTIQLTPGSALPTGGSLAFGDVSNTNGTLDLNGVNQTVSALSVVGSGASSTILNNSGSSNSTLTFAGGTSNFNGILADGSGGNKLVLTVTGGTLTLGGPNTYSGATSVNNGATLAVGAGGTLGNGSSALTVGSSTTVGNLDLSAGSATVARLAVPSNSATANTITIGAGKTLTLNGPALVGLAAATDGSNTSLTMTGGGAFSAAAAVSTDKFIVANTVVTSGTQGNSTLDASGLGSFTLSYPSGSIVIGSAPDGTAGNRGGGTLTLPSAGSSVLTASLLRIAFDDTNQASCNLNLGGTNQLHIDTFSVGAEKGSGHIQFTTGLINPTVQIRGSDGTSRVANLKVCDQSEYTGGSTSTNPTSSVNLSGGSADALVTTLTLAVAKKTATGTANPTGSLTFGNGTFDVTNVILGTNFTGTTQTVSGATGNLILATGGTGNFIVGAGGVILGAANAVTNASMYVGSFTINGATATLGADITDGGGTSTLTLNGGTLEMAAHNIGGANPIDTLNFQSGTLRNVAQINNGAGLTKTTAGTLILAGVNTYTGTTTISGGVLRANDDGSQLPSGNVTGNGGVLESSINFTRALGTGTSQVQLTGGASGFSAFGGNITVAIGGIGTETPLTWGTAQFNPSSLVLNSANADSTLNFTNPVDLNGVTQSVTVNANTATMSGVITNSTGTATITKTGSGTLVLAGNNTYNGGTTVTGGTLRVSSNGNLGAAGTGVTLDGGTLLLGGNVTDTARKITLTATGGTVDTAGFTGDFGAIDPGNFTKNGLGEMKVKSISANLLTINAGKMHVRASGGSTTGTSVLTDAPAIAPGAQLDVDDNAMVINYTGASPAAAVRASLVLGRGPAGFGNATWNGLGGITSSKASTAAQGLGGTGDGVNLAIGYAENSALPLGSYTSFKGQTVGASSILVKFTRGADADLDGIVGNSDVTIVGGKFGAAGSGEWYFGDFDYSGSCDNADVTALGGLFNPSAPPLSGEQLSAQFGSAFAAAFEAGASGGASAVPEPGSLTLLGLGGLGLLAARRRRSSRLSARS